MLGTVLAVGKYSFYSLGVFIEVGEIDTKYHCSVAQSCLTLCNPVDCSMSGFCVHHQLPELAQTHVHRVGDAIQPSHPLSSPSPPALSHHQGLYQRVSSLHQVAKVDSKYMNEKYLISSVIRAMRKKKKSTYFKL